MGAAGANPRSAGDAPELRRILSFDGGGIRGLFSLQIAARIEQLLRESTGRPDLVLADEFHMFAGTSTGAIIATCLAWGMPVADIERLYLDSGPSMFSPAPWWRRIYARYQSKQIARVLRETFCESNGEPALLGSSRLKRMLLVVMRNASTGSAWPLTNNPAALFNQRTLPDCNLNVPIWQILRASTAAPTFFPPEQIHMGEHTFAFVDGAITPYNNPALIAVLTATLPQYGLKWPTGWDRLLLVSIGTAGGRVKFSHKPVNRLHLIDYLTYMPLALLSSMGENQDAICRILGRCVHGDVIDLELGDLRTHTLLPPDEQKFTYARYNATLPVDIGIDAVSRMGDLCRLGRECAAQVKLEHLFPRAAAAESKT